LVKGGDTSQNPAGKTHHHKKKKHYESSLLVFFVCISLAAVAALADTSLRSGGRTTMTPISSPADRRPGFLNSALTFDVRQRPI
jgi:hypothetical protein